MPAGKSTENYLESILILSQQQKTVRAIDIVNTLGFSKPSVSIAMKNLRALNLVMTDADGHISLTPEGLAQAERVYERHTVLTTALLAIGVSPKTAREDACRLEHEISDETLDRLKDYMATLPCCAEKDARTKGPVFP